MFDKSKKFTFFLNIDDVLLKVDNTSFEVVEAYNLESNSPLLKKESMNAHFAKAVEFGVEISEAEYNRLLETARQKS